MTTHYAPVEASPGETAVGKLFDSDGISDVVRKTSASTADKTNDKGTYPFAFTDVSAGTYRIKPFAVSDGAPLAGAQLVTFTGSDNEVAVVGSDGIATLDPSVQTQIDTIEAAVTTPSISSSTVYRSTSDTRAITFSWPVDDATITGQVSINNADFVAVSGAIAFLRTESGINWYTLAFNSDDRPTTEGTARYQVTDGTYTRFFTLQVTGASSGGGGGGFAQEAY